MKRVTTMMSMAAILGTGASAATLEERVAALEEQNKVLSEEVLAEQTGGFTVVDTEKTYTGMGPAASKVYYSQSPLSIGGYGEMYYANPDNGGDYTDVYRFITYFGYKFSDNVILNAEIEFEHGDEVAIEFLYLDLLWKDEINFRVGNLLVPMGVVNLRHEPILFNTVQRPEVEKYLLPSTWHETGVLVYGRLNDLGLEYSAGIINALNMDSIKTGTPEKGWIRNGRKGSVPSSYKPAFVGRLDYTGMNGLVVGASLYYGDGTNTDDALVTASGLTTTMFDIHVMYENGPFRAYGLYTQTKLDGAENISNRAATKGEGYYLNASYNVGPLAGVDYRLPLFVQYEDYNPVASTVDGLNESQFDTKTTTVGLNFFPVDQAVLKLDYAMKKYKEQEDENIFSVGLGFVF